ncbi:PAS domain S-box protein [Paracoccus lichenicola]|nr:PAS domain S-box protein [Paracoccus lichenicola]
MVPTDAAPPWPPGPGGMARLIREHDWAATALGPLGGWPASLRTMVDLMLGSGMVMCLMWGRGGVAIYNDACARSIGQRHPAALGRPARETWADLRPTWEPLFERAWSGEEAEMRDRHLRSPGGARPEGWFDLTCTPVRTAGRVEGVLFIVRETTARVQAEHARKATEARLRESEARYRTLFEQLEESQRLRTAMLEVLPMGLALLGTDGQVLLSNLAWDRFIPSRRIPSRDLDRGWRWRASDDKGRPIAPHDYPVARALRAERCLPGIRFLYTDDSGDEIWTNVAAVPLVDAQGRVTGAVSIIMDIDAATRAEAALREREARQAFLLALGDALRVQDDEDGMIRAAAGLLGRHLGASRILFSEFYKAGGAADIVHEWRADGTRPFPAGMGPKDREGPILDDLRAGRTVQVEDTRAPAGARPDLAALAERGVGALLGVPLVVGGALVGTLSVHQDAPRRWSDDDAALVQEVAERLWADLVRARAETALRVSEARLSEAFRIQTVGVMFWSKDYLLIDMNDALLRMTGFTRDEAFGKTWAEFTPPEFHEASRRAVEEVLTRGESTPYEKPYVRKDGSRWWGLFAARRIGEEVVEFVLDITERREAEDRLRQSEERFRTIVETARDHAIFTTDLEGRIETWPAGAEAVFGWSAHEAVGQLMDMTFTPEDRANGVPEKERQEAREKGHAPNVRWHLRKDGTRVFIEGVDRPLTASDGTVTGFLKVGQDVTARRAVEAALRESEARFRQFGEASADVLWIRDRDSLAFEYVSPAFEAVYGTRIGDVLGGNHIRRWIEMIVPEDREKVLETVRRVRDGEPVLHSFRVLRGDGQIRRIRNTDFPLVDAEGRVQRIGGIAHDATEEVELQERLQVLVAELQHRSRNLVGVVKAITERTLATSDTLKDFGDRFRPRLDALGRVNGLLSRLEDGARITFDQLLQTELAAHGVLDGESHGTAISLEGPGGIRLRSATVQTFALALHELTTNALKYGALSRPGGQLEVRWRLVPGKGTEGRLRVDWRETRPRAADPGASPDRAGNGQPGARRRGYGRELIERALPYQLGAETLYEMAPEGVRCTIVVPVSSTLDVAFSSQGNPEG